MFSKEVGIDLGTANLLMYVKGEGIVIDEPSVVAIDAETKKCLAAGQDAKDMLGRTPGRVLAIRPLKDGVIADFEVTEIMLNFFFKKLAIKGMFKRPTILICCPSNITSTSLKIAGDTLDRDIIKFVKENKKLLIGDRTAEEVKKQIGTAWKGSMHETIEVSGRDLVTGLPTTITLSSEEIQGSMAESLQDVVRACKTVLEQTPPELASDIVTRGIVLTGGGALLHGIDELLRNELHIPVYVAENALRCVAEGTGILLENLHLVQ